MSGRGVVLLSGGLDSGTALALWLEAGATVECCIFADYGQRAVRREAAASEALARRFGVAWRPVALPWLREVALRAGSALVAGAATELPQRTAAEPGDAASAAAVWVPARNVALLAVAASFADASACTHLVAGFNCEEAATFADNSIAFCAAFDAVLALGTRAGVRVASPTAEFDKATIAAAARRLGLAASDFWSCYAADSDPTTCACESCVRSRRAWSAC